MDKIKLLISEIEERIVDLEKNDTIKKDVKLALIRENTKILVRCQQLFLQDVGVKLCQCKRAEFSRIVDSDYNPFCGRCGRSIK